MTAPRRSDPLQTCCALTLFVSGASDISARAIADARGLCDAHLEGRVQLSVVDIHGSPEAVRENGVIVTPTLIRTLPLPSRRVVGDLSDGAAVLSTLGLSVAKTAPSVG